MQDRLRKSLQIIKSLQEQLAEKRSTEKVSILGLSFTFPGENNTYSSFWETLNQKKHAITKYPEDRIDLLNLSEEEIAHVSGGFIDSIDQFDPGFFNVGLEEARAMDPQHRILLEQVWRAFEDSNINIEEYKGKKVGVFVALSNNDYACQRFRTDQEKVPMTSPVIYWQPQQEESHTLTISEDLPLLWIQPAPQHWLPWTRHIIH